MSVLPPGRTAAQDALAAPSSGAEADRPRLRGRLHQLAAAAAVPFGVALVAGARAHRLAAVLYAVSVTAVFAASAAYHRPGWSQRALRRMKQLDHCTIFAFTAASYTALSRVALDGAGAVVLTVAVWTGAALGIGAKLRDVDAAGRVADVLYLAVGWSGLIVLPQLVAALGPVELGLLFGGGLLLTLAAVPLTLRRPDPFPSVFGYHEVAHALILLGIVSHFLLFWRLLDGV